MEFIINLLADQPYFQLIAAVIALASAVAAVTHQRQKPALNLQNFISLLI